MNTQSIDYKALYYAKRGECLQHWILEAKAMSLLCQYEVSLSALVDNPNDITAYNRAKALLDITKRGQLDKDGLISLFLFLILTLTDWSSSLLVTLAQTVPSNSKCLNQPWFAALWGAGDPVSAIQFARNELRGGTQ